MSTNLQTAFAAKAYLAEGQWLEEQMNMVKLLVHVFRAGVRMSTVSMSEGRHLAPI
jgi:hypothetical protein